VRRGVHVPGGHRRLLGELLQRGGLVDDVVALGDVAFRHTVLQVADHPEQTLVYFTTDEVPQAKLAALAAEIG
jgi:hypothetical protein